MFLLVKILFMLESTERIAVRRMTAMKETVCPAVCDCLGVLENQWNQRAINDRKIKCSMKSHVFALQRRFWMELVV